MGLQPAPARPGTLGGPISRAIGFLRPSRGGESLAAGRRMGDAEESLLQEAQRRRYLWAESPEATAAAAEVEEKEAACIVARENGEEERDEEIDWDVSDDGESVQHDATDNCKVEGDEFQPAQIESEVKLSLPCAKSPVRMPASTVKLYKCLSLS
jgi:hypothetical protein